MVTVLIVSLTPHLVASARLHNEVADGEQVDGFSATQVGVRSKKPGGYKQSATIANFVGHSATLGAIVDRSLFTCKSEILPP